MTPNDVKAWAVDRGIGHALQLTRGHWVLTVCGSFATFSQTDTKPSRICRKCREGLRFAVHSQGETAP